MTSSGKERTREKSGSDAVAMAGTYDCLLTGVFVSQAAESGIEAPLLIVERPAPNQASITFYCNLISLYPPPSPPPLLRCYPMPIAHPGTSQIIPNDFWPYPYAHPRCFRKGGRWFRKDCAVVCLRQRQQHIWGGIYICIAIA